MPTFDFSISKKKTKNRKTSKNTKQYEVIKKGITGVVWIDKNSNYVVKLDNNHRYNIHPDCYSCKDKEKIYSRKLDNNRRVCIIRNSNEYYNCNINCYLPFAPGCIVIGNIVAIGFATYFYINKCYVDFNNDDSHDALMYYRQNYNEIINNIRNNKLNEI